MNRTQNKAKKTSERGDNNDVGSYYDADDADCDHDDLTITITTVGTIMTMARTSVMAMKTVFPTITHAFFFKRTKAIRRRLECGNQSAVRRKPTAKTTIRTTEHVTDSNYTTYSTYS